MVLLLTTPILLAPAASATTSDFVVVPSNTTSAGWVEEALELAGDIAWTSAGIVITAVVALCKAATAACPW